MALSLMEAVKILENEGRYFEAGVIEIYAKSSPFMAAMLWKNISGNSIAYNKEGTLPPWQFRGVNESYTAGNAKFDPATERLAIAGGDLDVDRYEVRTGGPKVRAAQEAAQIKGLSLGMTREIIKGDINSNTKGIDGIQVRATNAGKLVAAGTTDGGDALSLTVLDEAISEVNDPTHLVMDSRLAVKFTAAIRNPNLGGNITISKDEWGMPVYEYSGLPIVPVKTDDQRARILDFTEVSNNVSATATATSLYVVSIRDDGLVGLQTEMPRAYDLGEVPDKPVYRTRIDWYLTLATMDPDCLMRIWSIKNAALVA